MGSILYSTICHYCDEPAETEDHVVPRAALPRPLIRLDHMGARWFRELDIVPCCFWCNNFKENFRSDCACGLCNYLWAAAIAQRFIVDEYEMPAQVVELVRKNVSKNRNVVKTLESQAHGVKVKIFDDGTIRVDYDAPFPVVIEQAWLTGARVKNITLTPVKPEDPE